jgi:hypothetical protein
LSSFLGNLSKNGHLFSESIFKFLRFGYCLTRRRDHQCVHRWTSLYFFLVLIAAYLIHIDHLFAIVLDCVFIW